MARLVAGQTPGGEMFDLAINRRRFGTVQIDRSESHGT